MGPGLRPAGEVDDPISAPLASAGEIAARAHADAALEVERRSVFTTVVIVLIAALFRFANDSAAAHVFDLALVAVSPMAAGRLGLFAYARRLAPGSAARRLAMFAPLLLLVTAWGAFAAWGAVVTKGSGLGTVIVATQCLCAAAVVISYAGTPRLAVVVIAITILPTACGVIFAASGLDRVSGGGAVLYCAMLVSYLPRVARERHAAVMSMLLLEERARSLEAARDAALSAAAAREAFVANLSHEIRTPLHGVLGTVERLKHTALDDGQRTAVEHLERSGRRLLDTLNDAIDSARLASGELLLHVERFSLPALLREVVDLFVDEAQKRGLALTLETEQVVEHAAGDAARLRQVLQNLVGNAVKFTDRGSVTVVARTVAREERDDGGAALVDLVDLVVDVVDTGVGFAPGDATRLFHRYSQLHGGGDRSGSGLGLAISAELARLMGGRIDAKSAGHGRGATFSLRVPLRAEDTAPIPVAGRRVLVVDDNPVNLAVARGYLQSLGVFVDVAAGGSEALLRTEGARYDAILMDCDMPDKDGFETTRALRDRGDTTPVLAVTAASGGSVESRCRAAGMHALVEKPISSTGLRDALARVLD